MPDRMRLLLRQSAVRVKGAAAQFDRMIDSRVKILIANFPRDRPYFMIPIDLSMVRVILLASEPSAGLSSNS